MQFGAIIPRIDSHLDKISQAQPETYNGGNGYWDGRLRCLFREASVETHDTLSDYCLAHFLRGVALSFAAYPVSPTYHWRKVTGLKPGNSQHEEALITEKDLNSYPTTAEAAGLDAMSSFQHVLEHAIDIQVRFSKHRPQQYLKQDRGYWLQLDHWIIYFTHFEMGRLYSQMGDNDSARIQLELVMSGKSSASGPQC